MKIMLVCRDVAGLVSESLDRPLTLRERVAVRFHTMMCAACTAYRRQLRALATLVRLRAAHGEPPVPATDIVLPAQVQDRIVAALREDDVDPSVFPA